MKLNKKLLTLALIAIMMLAMAVTVYAAGEGKTITLEGGKAGHTYTLYQIFTGTVDGDELTNLQWGTGVNAAYKAQYATAAACAEAIADKGDARATAQEIVEGAEGSSYLGAAFGDACVLTEDGDVEFTDLPEGYYLIVDTNNNQSVVEGDYNSAYIVKVVKDVTGEIKGDSATSDKAVVDPETGEAAADTVDAAAYNIGDDVPFILTATTADNVASYKKYHITFQDKQSAGLDAPESFTVTVLGETFTVPAEGEDPAAKTTANGTKITVSKVTPDSGNTFAIKVEFEPTGEGVTYLNSECNNTTITVNYTSTLNENAEIGLPGNENKSHITYSNNPEDEDGGDEGKTPDDTVKVFTYKTVIDKVDEAGNALADAGFTLYKEVAEGTTDAVLGSEIEFADGVEHSAIDNEKYYVVKEMTLVSGSTNQFEFKGLADGTYVLVETAIPDGYNAFNSVEFTISSTVTEDGITSLTGTDPFTTTNPGEDGDVTSGTHALDSGELYAEIENNSGQVLPETGGMGTRIFYVVGSILVLAAGVILVVRRRAAAH